MKTDSLHNAAFEQLRFGAYRGTTTTKSWQEVVEALTGGDDRIDVRHGLADVPRYTKGAYISITGTQYAKVLWSPGLPEVFFEAVDEYFISPLRDHVRHEVTSATIFLETSQPFAFEDILTRCVLVQRSNPRVRAVRDGDWGERRKRSRTFTLGARSSVCQIVLHEVAPEPEPEPWWRQQVMVPADLVRLEWRFRPETGAQKLAAAGCSPAELFMLSDMAWDVADLVLSQGLISGAAANPDPTQGCGNENFDALVRGYSDLLQALGNREESQEAVLATMRAGLQAASVLRTHAGVTQ